MSYNLHTLPNGLRIIHELTDSKVAYCGYAVNAGTRDEFAKESGMAHLVEHLLFKGTKHRKAWHIINRMENVGGDLNAFTSKEETIIYSAFLVEHFTRAVDLLTDIVFNSTFPDEEIDKEVEVIIDEISSYKDSPSELIFDDFEALLYNGHPLGRDILGTTDYLKDFKSEDVKTFTNRFYHPNNMVFFVRGNLSFNRIIKVLEKFTMSIPQSKISHNRITPTEYTPTDKTIVKDTHQAHVMLGAPSYNAFDKRRTALYLLNNILGGPGMNSRLNVSLRERNGLVYSVESNVTSYTDTGLFSIYFGIDATDIEKAIGLVSKELKDLMDNRLSSLQLSMAKKQLIGQIGVASDHSESLALSMGKSFLHYDRYDTHEQLCERIIKLTSTDLLEVANEVFDFDKLTTLIYK